jgi:hypothetical protein
LPRNATLAAEVFFVSQPHAALGAAAGTEAGAGVTDRAAGAGDGVGAGGETAAPFFGAPFNFPSTSATTSRIKVSFTALIKI